MRDLSIEFLGFRCKNPFFLAASPVARTGDMVCRAYQAGWGGVVTKSISLDQDLPDHGLSPRFVGVRSGGADHMLQRNYTGMGNIDFRIDMSVQETFDGFAWAKRQFPDHMLIISIKCRYQREDWQEMARRCEAAGADAIEACLSCPDSSGLPVCCNPEAVCRVIGWIKEATVLPVMVKLGGICDSIGAIAQAAFGGGADAVSGINTLKAVGGWNPVTRHMMPTVGNETAVVGLSGGMIKPTAQYCVYEMARRNPGRPISGIGGVTCGIDALEYLLLGASTVQVATQVMLEGYGVVEDLQLTLSNYLEESGAADAAELVGTAVGQVQPSTEALSREQQLRAVIDQNRCIRCGRCYVSCRDGAYQAIRFGPDRVPQVDRALCAGCGLCRIVCPVPGVIRYADAADGTRLRDGLN